MVPEIKQDGNLTKDRKIYGESNVWSTAQRSKDLMLMLGLHETIDQLGMANNVHWHCHALREDGHVLRTLDLDVKDQRKKGRSKRIWKKQVEDENAKVFFYLGICILPNKSEC